MTDVFANAHRAKERADKLKATKEEAERPKQIATKRMLDNMKPKPNDLPQYKFRDIFKFGGPR